MIREDRKMLVNIVVFITIIKCNSLYRYSFALDNPCQALFRCFEQRVKYVKENRKARYNARSNQIVIIPPLVGHATNPGGVRCGVYQCGVYFVHSSSELFHSWSMMEIKMLVNLDREIVN